MLKKIALTTSAILAILLIGRIFLIEIAVYYFFWVKATSSTEYLLNCGRGTQVVFANSVLLHYSEEPTAWEDCPKDAHNRETSLIEACPLKTERVGTCNEPHPQLDALLRLQSEF
jgi:hypothetical protein